MSILYKQYKHIIVAIVGMYIVVLIYATFKYVIVICAITTNYIHN